MTLLGSGTQILSDLRIVANETLTAHPLRSPPLIHVTKEIGALLLDQELYADTLLLRRNTIHGIEVGLRRNEIFQRFVPLGKTLGRLAKEFGLFIAVEKRNQTVLVPLQHTPPDLSDLVAHPKAFAEEAGFLGSLGFTAKNVLATHRNLRMTLESHQTVAQLFIHYNSKLLKDLNSRRFSSVTRLVDRMNECADELVMKSAYYPAQATILRKKLLKGNNAIGKFLGGCIQPHEESVDELISISEVILRGSHLIRSRLYNIGLYLVRSKPVHTQQNRFSKACRSVDIDPPRKAEGFEYVKTLAHFLNSIVRTRLIWWGKGYGKSCS